MMAASLAAMNVMSSYVACVRCQAVFSGYERIIQPLLEIEREILELVQIHLYGNTYNQDSILLLGNQRKKGTIR